LSAVDSLAEKHFQSTASPNTVAPAELPARTDSNRSSVVSPTSIQSWADQDDEEKTPDTAQSKKMYRTLSDVVKVKCAENVQTDEVTVITEVQHVHQKPDNHYQISGFNFPFAQYTPENIYSINGSLKIQKVDKIPYIPTSTIDNLKTLSGPVEYDFYFLVKNEKFETSGIVFCKLQNIKGNCVELLGFIPDQIEDPREFERIFGILQEMLGDIFEVCYISPKEAKDKKEKPLLISWFFDRVMKGNIKESRYLYGPAGSFIDRIIKEQKDQEFPELVQMVVSAPKSEKSEVVMERVRTKKQPNKQRVQTKK
jgi:hypothetical protein